MFFRFYIISLTIEIISFFFDFLDFEKRVLDLSRKKGIGFIKKKGYWIYQEKGGGRRGTQGLAEQAPLRSRSDLPSVSLQGDLRPWHCVAPLQNDIKKSSV
jgi:hypothetical protein